MKATINESFPGATPERLFAHIAILDRYPPWMRLVHRATPMPPDDLGPAWWVELRARVGPFTRSNSYAWFVRSASTTSASCSNGSNKTNATMPDGS